MNALVLNLTRLAVRAIFLVAGLVLFMGLLAVAGVLLLLWSARAAWARLTGQTVRPWVMPMGGASASWRSWQAMRTQAQGFAAKTRTNASTGTHTSQPGRRSGVLPQVATEVTDVQARDC